MKHSRIFIALFVLAALLGACKEENPGVIFVVPEKPLLDTTYSTSSIPAAQDHDVLLFDMTGVRCVNCPDAATIARRIADTLNPGRVVVVAIYPEAAGLGPNVWPWPGYDTMSNVYSEGINQFLGGVTQLPMGCVDQISVSGSRFLQRATWVSNVNNRLAISTPVNIDLNTKWDLLNNRSRLEAKVTYTSAVSSKHLIFIGVTESHVIGKQSSNKGEILNYEHNHALRKLYTASTGDTLKADLTAGRVFEKHYYITPDKKWNAANMDAVVWVVDATTKEVVQVAHAKIKP